jgi:hypothetical protein
MKKLVVWMVVLGGACGLGLWFLRHVASKSAGFAVGYALGNPHEDNVELHVVVSISMIRYEGPRLSGSGATLWDDWIAEHFAVRDASGQKVTLQKVGWSDLITERQANNPEFYLVGKLRARGTYTFDYIPFRDSTLRFRHTLTVLSQGQPFERRIFRQMMGGQ